MLGPAASAWSVGAARLAVAGLVLAALAVAAGGWRELRAAARRRAAWVAGLGQAGFQVTFLAAVELTGVAVGTLLAIASAPVWSGLLTREVTRRWALATGVAVTGLAVLVAGGGGRPLSAPGVSLALGAGFSYAVYTVASRALVVAGHAPAAVTGASFLVAALLLLPGLVLADLAWLPTAGGLALVAYLALLPTVLAYRLFVRGLTAVPAPVASTLGLVEPVVATALGVLVLDEALTAAGVVGTLLVLAGLALLVLPAGARGSTP